MGMGPFNFYMECKGVWQNVACDAELQLLNDFKGT